MWCKLNNNSDVDNDGDDDCDKWINYDDYDVVDTYNNRNYKYS